MREPPRPRAARAIGCLSFLAILAALPMILVGAFLVLISDGPNGGGPTAGLSAFSAAGGIAIIAIALVVLVVAAIAFIWSAND